MEKETHIRSRVFKKAGASHEYELVGHTLLRRPAGSAEPMMPASTPFKPRWEAFRTPYSVEEYAELLLQLGFTCEVVS